MKHYVRLGLLMGLVATNVAAAAQLAQSHEQQPGFVAHKIYTAGPLFTLAERQFITSLTTFLRTKGFQLLVPQEMCDGETDTKKIFELCRNSIDEASLVLAILDGSDADSGTCWEVGYAYARGKTIVGIRTDFRQTGDTGSLNCMLVFGATEVIILNCLAQTDQQIYEAIASALSKYLPTL